MAKKALISTIYPVFLPLMNAVLDADSRNIERLRQRKALEETRRFIEQHMPDVPSVRDPSALLRHALSHVGDGGDDEGLACEFGVYTGKSINEIARLLPHSTVWGFDSFEGLPEDWRDRFPKGTYAVKKMSRTRRNVRLVKGFYDETLAPFLRAHPGKARFLHIDCDLYSSTRTVLDAFAERIQPGTVVVFDEFFNYPGWQEGEYKAFAEFVEKARIDFAYLGYCRYGEQVAVKFVPPS
jgi:hypothetical protein